MPEPASAAERLAELVRIPTVSIGIGPDEQLLATFRARLAQLYPVSHARLDHEVVGRGGLLFRWVGRTTVDPIVLMAHQDVVPVESQHWASEPFDGSVRDGVVHGRGALDDKGALVAAIEAVETLLAEGVVPDQDVYLAFGADEEVAGSTAPAIVALLESRGVRPGLVLDEGGAVVEGALPGLAGPIAFVGLAEKGIATITLTARAAGGHASTPPKGGAAARIARAITRIERHPFPARTSEIHRAMLEALAPRLPRLPARAARLASPAIGPLLGLLGGLPAALARTTVAVTQLRGSAAPNVLASEASAVLNVRIVPGETIAGTVVRLRRIIRDTTIELTVSNASEPCPVSPHAGTAWERIRAAVGVAYPDALLSPHLMVQASDARFFTRISDHVYRFLPFAITAQQLAAIHGPDESLDVAALEAGIAFHRALLTPAG